MEISIQRTGRDFHEVHECLDEPEEKAERHDTTKIPDIFRRFK